MQKKILPEAEQYTKQNKLRRIWHKIVQVMACIVVFCTTYALILPAITLEKPTVCGIEVHTHTVECYREAAQTQQTQIVCTALHHSHTEQCQDANGSLICIWDAEFLHLHNDSCRNEAGELICPMEEKEAHTHDGDCYAPAEPHVHEDSCYTVTPGELTCTLEETEGHTHGDGCSQSSLTCTAHIHSAECWQQDLICTEEAAEASSYEEAVSETVLTCESVEEGHVHDETACYETVTTTQTVEVAGHTHGDGCYQNTLICGQPEEAHTHAEGCYETTVICTLEETEGHAHIDTCYAQNRELTCGKDEQMEEGALELVCSEEEYIPHIHEGDCFTEYTAEDGTEYSVLTCTRPQVWEHYHSEECIVTAAVSADPEELTCTLEESEGHTHGETCQDETGALVCELEENAGHTHGELCYGRWELICGLAEHTHADKCYAELTEEELAQVEYVIWLIDEMPSADEIDAKVAEFEEAGDDEGEEAYLTEVYQQVNSVYAEYDLLTDIQKAYVTNADKLLELEYIWSVQPLAVTTDRPTIYQINSYDRSDGDFDGDSPLAVMVHGDGTKTVQDILGVPDTWTFYYWYAVTVTTVEENNTSYLKVSSVAAPYSNKLAYIPPANGYILFFRETQVIPDTAVGDYVTINFTVPESGVEKSGGYGTVSFSSISPIHSATPTPTWYTSTKDFIELNLYDYTYGINDRWESDKKYPGFQWNGGAYAKSEYKNANASADAGIPNNITDRNYVDSIDFGNSIITNFQYQGSDYVKSTTATQVGYLYNNSNAANTGKINWLWYNGSDYATTTNRPVGFSTQVVKDGATVYTQSIANTLKDGYPALVDGTSLAYLFGGTSDSYVIKQNTESIDGLFQQNATTGEYNYNSRTNHAQYSNNKFTLYEEIITPNFITYPFGNFLPLNTISDTTQATQVGAFNYNGGMGQYVEALMEDLQDALDRDDDGNGATADYGDTSRSQLLTMLAEYKENWEWYAMKGTSTYWYNLSPANAIRDYFFGDSSGAGDKPSSDDSFVTQSHLDQMYNIDWDVATNFFFGMEMKMRFLQPKDGLTGNDTNKDGTPDYPMEFYFTGDDDVWVYIDDVLFLDLTGIHRHVGGKIDFVNGKVYYYELQPSTTGDVSESEYAWYSFAAILRAAGWTEAQIDEVLKPENSAGNRPFKDYTNHTFNFYYVERGSGSSVCRLNFNFPLLRQNTIAVEKELSADDATLDALGDPDFKFQILDVDDNGNKTENSFFAQHDGAGNLWAYTLYDVDGSLLQEVKVTERYEDGTVKTLEVYNAEGKLVRRETEDADGNPVITNYPENGEVLTIDENGVFTLKAGQRAEFVGIPENWGQYYVRELIDNLDLGQYGTITVSGEMATERENVIVGDTIYKGLESPILDMSSGSTVFKINNQIKVAELEDLSITKMLENDLSDSAGDKTFKMNVTLDGELLPVGTAYTLSDGTQKTVAEAGVIELTAGQTATISNIISGTKFTVSEDSGSAEGYVVTYAQTDADEAEVTSGGVSGVIRVNTTVAVTVTNTLNAVEVPITGTKTVSNGSCDTNTSGRTYTFTLTQVADAQGTALAEDTTPYSDTQTVTVQGTGPGTFAFAIPYVHTSEAGIYYYKITETASSESDVIMDTSCYIATVTVTKADSGLISAELTSLTKNDGTTVESAAFFNTLTGDLSLQKLVDGSEAAQTSATFDFRFTFTDDSGKPLTGSYSATLWSINDQGELESSAETLPLDENGAVTLSKFYHSEFATIHGLPAGTTWKIEELSADGYIVSWTVNGTAAENVSNSVSGTVLNSEVKVVCTNTSTYVLPETGGIGTYVYTMAGMMLMLFSAAYLLYRFSKRRREAC